MPTIQVPVTCPHCKKTVTVTAEIPENDPAKTTRMVKGMTVDDTCPECGKNIKISR